MSSTPQPSIHFDPKTMKPQNWSIPESIVYYMAKNPSSFKVYDKLVDSCKYFFHINPIIVVASLKYCKKREEDESDGEEMDVENDSGASNVSYVFDSDDDSDDGMVESDASDDEEMGVQSNSDAEGRASDISNDEDMEDGELESDTDNVNGGVIQDINNGDVVAKADDDGKKLTVCLECDCEENGCCIEIDLKTFKSKIWITSDLPIDGFHEIRSDLMPKLASFEFDRPSIVNSQIFFDDLAAIQPLLSCL